MSAEEAGGEEGGRTECFKKTPWMHEEDEALRRGVREHGPKNWDAIARASRAHLQVVPAAVVPAPGAGAGQPPIHAREDEEIIQKQREFGNKWATIERYLPGRSDNAVKNRWNAALRKQQEAAHEPEDV